MGRGGGGGGDTMGGWGGGGGTDTGHGTIYWGVLLVINGRACQQCCFFPAPAWRKGPPFSISSQVSG